MQNARFITFEGGEGSGKSTQARLLADRLTRLGIDVAVTREPGGSPFAERLRAVILDPTLPSHAPISETLLFYAARADHLAQVIRPALADGRWVVCDRFSDSTAVYQGVAGGVAAGVIDALEALIVAPTRPDLTLVIDTPVGEGLARARRRRPEATDPYETREIAFHEKLRAGFLDLANRNPDRCVVVDGRAPVEVVSSQVWDAVATRLSLEPA